MNLDVRASSGSSTRGAGGARPRPTLPALALCAALASSWAHAGLVNGNFSQPSVGAKGMKHLPGNGVPGWTTTDTHIEIWSSGFTTGGMTFDAPAGLTQFAEINAHTDGTLSQVVSNIKPGSNYGFSFYHRGRASATTPDVIQVKVVDQVSGEKLLDQSFSTTNAAWKRYTIDLGTKKNANPLVLSFTAVSSASNDKSVGNFLAGVELGEEFKMVPTAAVATAAPSAGAAGGDLALGRAISLRSVNNADRYVRHRSFVGELTTIASDLDKKDASFIVRPGNAPGGVSFESVNFPGHFLRHQGFVIKLHKAEDSDLYKKDTTFIVKKGRSGDAADRYSLHAVNAPDHAIRHCSFRMFIDNNQRGNAACNASVFDADTTFQVVPALGG